MLKKKLLIFISLVLIIGLVAACSPATQDQPADASPQPAEPATEKPSPEAEEPDTEAEAPDSAESPESSGNLEILSTGPKGETATPATEITLTDEEIEKVKEGNYTAAIVLHYAGNDWSTAQVQGLTDTFNSLGIEVIAVTDASFGAEKQVSDIENVMAMNPDIIVSIPVDPVSTAPAYKRAAEAGIKIVFMDNVPDGLEHGKDYVSVVSADNYGNGIVAAEIMAEELNYEGEIGVIFHDADFFVTRQRVEAFEKTIEEKYPNIKIVARGGFDDPNAVSGVADGMLTRYPNLDGIFAVWDVPAEGVLASARAAGREDLVITTIDLGDNAAREIAAGGPIKGLGAQLPYDQGVAEAKLAAYALLGKEAPDYVAVPALKVTRDNILEAYEQVYHKEPPKILRDLLEDN